MKKSIASLAALLLVVAIAAPAFGADNDRADGFAWTFDLHQIVNSLATLWFDLAPADTPQPANGEQPRAFIEGVGPYIVPVGSSASNDDAATIDQGGDSDGSDSGSGSEG